MFNRKLFKISLISNIVSWLSVSVTTSIAESKQQDFSFYLVFAVVLTIIVLSFEVACLNLYRKYDEKTSFKKESIILSTAISLVYSLLVLLFLFCWIEMTKEFFTTDTHEDIEANLLFCFFCCFMITSIYLVIAYWIIRKNAKAQIINIVSALGNETES